MAMIGKVWRMYFRHKTSVREIVRLTNLSRNTVRNWLKTPLEGEPRYHVLRAALTAVNSAVHTHLKGQF